MNEMRKYLRSIRTLPVDEYTEMAMGYIEVYFPYLDHNSVCHALSEEYKGGAYHV